MKEIAAPESSRGPTDREWVEVLAEFPFFADVRRRHLRRLVRDAHFAEFPPGSEVVSHGGTADAFYVVLGGKARARGKRVARTLGIGDFFGEMALSGGSRSATIVALEELHVLKVPRRAFLRLVEEEPSIRSALMQELGQRARRLELAPALG
jgi:CRP-like cAMP-binding protein